MSTTYSVYDPTTGQFTGSVITMPEELVDQNTPEGMKLLVGVFNSRTQQLDLATMEVVPREDTGLADRQARLVRMKRDSLLSACDWVVVRAHEAGAQVSQEWRAYRQALRSLTDQQGFPADVVWPTPPLS